MLESPTPDRKATVLLLLAMAGCVDAVGLSETGRYFVSYMSGNTTSAGLAIAYRDWRGAILPLGLVALFVAGATSGTMIAEKAGRFGTAALLIAEAVLLATAWAGFGSPRPMAGLIALPVAMGLANIVTVHRGGPSPGVTYSTGALVKLGIGLAGLGREANARDVVFDLMIWLALLTGGVLGAAGRLRYGIDVLLGVVALLLVMALFHLGMALRDRRV
jgi:uncharacterized membrane protein YoaK (UPF0700 family)